MHFFLKKQVQHRPVRIDMKECSPKVTDPLLVPKRWSRNPVPRSYGSRSSIWWGVVENWRTWVWGVRKYSIRKLCLGYRQCEARKTFSQYLQCVLKRISTMPEQEGHVEIVLKFLQKASNYLRTPFSVKVSCFCFAICDSKIPSDHNITSLWHFWHEKLLNLLTIHWLWPIKEWNCVIIHSYQK